MASKLQRAKLALSNPDADTHQLENILADIQIVLTTNNGTLDPATRHRYVEMKVLLENKLDPQKTQEKAVAREKKDEQYAAKQKYFEQKAAAVKIEQQRPKISTDVIKHYSKREFFPDNPKAGNMFWLNRSYIGIVEDKRSLYHPSCTLNIQGTKHPLWIGDLRINSLDLVPCKNYWGDELSPDKVINATPVINIERVEALYAFYSALEHKPEVYGELGWTRNTPEIARPKNLPSPIHILSQEDIIKHNETYINSMSQYLIKIRGFVIFLDIMSNNDLNRTVFDIEYTGTNGRGNSGTGRLVNNKIRELVTQNIDQYRQLEKELKQ